MQKKAPETPKPAPMEIDFSSYQIANPEEFSRNMLKLMEDGSKVFSGLLGRSNGNGGPLSIAGEFAEAGKLFAEVAQHWTDPAKLAASQGALLSNYLQLAGATAQRMMGAEVPPVVQPETGDNRFNDPEWSRNPFFDFWKQVYLITTRWLEQVLEETEGLDERTRQRAEFLLKQLASAFSPSNFPMTNPVVLRETLSSSGSNLVRGMENLIHDMEKSSDVLSISQTDVNAFEVGRNIATSPGKVVFQNDLI